MDLKSTYIRDFIEEIAEFLYNSVVIDDPSEFIQYIAKINEIIKKISHQLQTTQIKYIERLISSLIAFTESRTFYPIKSVDFITEFFSGEPNFEAIKIPLVFCVLENIKNKKYRIWILDLEQKIGEIIPIIEEQKKWMQENSDLEYDGFILSYSDKDINLQQGSSAQQQRNNLYFENCIYLGSVLFDLDHNLIIDSTSSTVWITIEPKFSEIIRKNQYFAIEHAVNPDNFPIIFGKIKMISAFRNPEYIINALIDNLLLFDSVENNLELLDRPIDLKDFRCRQLTIYEEKTLSDWRNKNE